MLHRAFGRGVLVAIAASTLLVVGCSLVLSFDESQIPSEATDGAVETSTDSAEIDSIVPDSGETDSGEMDSGATDSGAETTPPTDSGADVVGDVPVDSGSDTGTPATDSGSDTGMMDMGTTDTADAFVATPSTFAGCTTSDYAAHDFSGTPGTPAEITFPGASFQYTPKCIRVKAGQGVKWTPDGSLTFADHPLRHAPGNPDGSKIPDQNSGTTFTETFSVTGFYGYYCNFHGDSTGGGMSGAIEVVP